SDGVAWVQIGRCATAASAKECANVAPRTRYSIDVRTDEGIQVVAQMLERGASVLAAPLGVSAPATTWTFPVSTVTGEVDRRLSIFDAQAAPATVSVTFVHDGAIGQLSTLQHVVVRSGRSVTLVVGGHRIRSGAMVVTSDIPVAVDRRITASGDAAVSPG